MIATRRRFSGGGQAWRLYLPVRSTDGLYWLALAIVLVLGALPALRLAIAVIADPSSLETISQRAALRALGHTLITGLCAGLLSVLIGGCAALLVTLGDIRIRKFFTVCFTLSMLIAPQIVALGYLEAVRGIAPIVWQPANGTMQGWSHPLRSLGGIIAVLAIHHTPLAFLTIRAGLIRIPRDVLEAASLDGAHGLSWLTRVILPLIRNQISVAALLCFIAAAGNFGIPAMLGISENILTLPTLIYRRLSGLGPGMIPDMAALGLILVVLAIFALAAAQILNGKITPLVGDAASPIGMCPLGRWRFSSEILLSLLLFIAAFVPVTALIWAALTPAPGVALTINTITSANFIDVFGNLAGAPLRAIGNSFLFSGLAAFLCAILSLICVFAFGRLKPRTRAVVEPLSDWPFAMPGVVLAVSFILLFLKPLPLVHVSLYGTATIIIMAYVARFFVLTLKPALAALDASDPNIEEAALLCGAGRYALIRYILLPAIGPALFSGAIIIFLTAFNELTVSALLWGPGTQTLGVVMFGYEEAGLSGQAAVLGLTGLAVGAIAVWVIDRLRHYCPPGAIPWR